MAINFDNTEEAFKYRTTSELKQVNLLFKLLNHKIIGTVGKAFLKFAVNAGLPVKGLIKATLYKHFVGGETLEDCLPLVEKLEKNNVKAILDYSEEGKSDEKDIEHAFLALMENVKFAGAHPKIPLTVFKPTAIGAHAIFGKVSAGEKLKPVEDEAWKRIKARFDKLCETAYSLKIPIRIDAEEYSTQQAMDDLAHEAMEKYNKERVTVINTFQMYRNDRLDYLKKSHAVSRQKGYFYGAKLVRGAYMEKERKWAIEKGYPSPIHKTKAETDHAYNEAVRFCMEHIEDTFLFVGTHNEDSCRVAADLMEKAGLPNNHHHVWFSQLLGMCDHISFTLGHLGYNVAKYVPYGPVKTVTPYLIRRADENSSVAGQAKKEMALLQQELRRRKSSHQSTVISHQ
jgi:proline dehydrogenase